MRSCGGEGGSEWGGAGDTSADGGASEKARVNLSLWLGLTKAGLESEKSCKKKVFLWNLLDDC